MSIDVPAVVVAERSGTVVSQNAPARRLMGSGKGENCWDLIGGLKNSVGLPCRRDCVSGLLAGVEPSKYARPEIEGQQHHLACIPVDDVVVCILGHGTEELSEKRESLTGREREVLHLLAAGETTPSAATLLGISESTVRTHVEKMRAKLGVNTRAALVAKGFRSGYLG